MARLTTFSRLLFIIVGLAALIAFVAWALPSCNSDSDNNQQQHYVQQPTAPVYAETDIIPDYNFSQAQARADFENGYSAGWNDYPLHSALYSYNYVFQPNFVEGWQQGHNDRIHQRAWNSYYAFGTYWGLMSSNNPAWAWQRTYGYYNDYVPTQYRQRIVTTTQQRQTSYESDLSAARQRVEAARQEQQRAQERVETARQKQQAQPVQQPKRTYNEAVEDMSQRQYKAQPTETNRTSAWDKQNRTPADNGGYKPTTPARTSSPSNPGYKTTTPANNNRGYTPTTPARTYTPPSNNSYKPTTPAAPKNTPPSTGRKSKF